MNNEMIRATAKLYGVKLWEIAERLKLCDGNFSRKLRHELPDIERDSIMLIIEQISVEKKQKGEFQNGEGN